MKKPSNKKLIEFIQESNAIEGVYSPQADIDSMGAWDFAFNNSNKINVNFILNIHLLLAKNMNQRIAGRIRNCDVYIGGERKRFLSEQIIKESLDGLCKKINKSVSDNLTKSIPVKEREEIAKKLHIEFEEIHPFEDFNGRTGRIIFNIHRILLGLPILIIHADIRDYYGHEQREYYDWFRNK